MAMSASVLAAARKAAIDAVGPPLEGETMSAYRLRLQVADSQAIITHIQTYAVVTVPSVTGVQPGSGVSGPGTGTVA